MAIPRRRIPSLLGEYPAGSADAIESRPALRPEPASNPGGQPAKRVSTICRKIHKTAQVNEAFFRQRANRMAAFRKDQGGFNQRPAGCVNLGKNEKTGEKS